ncbi:hypothetical protein [Amycolatopsis sp. NPDC004079]|uniref:hypothetical protein n=1 Tax=Amycolatopsis sp. NPDC004079 TaxID=3154549 RepID=UPI0033A08999
MIVDATTPQPRIVELKVRSTGNGLTSQSIPPVDLDLLVRAFLPSAEEPGKPAVKFRQAVAETPETPSDPPGSGSPDGGGRAYRKMPEVAEVLAVYEQTGTVTAMAAHFGVPRHTAQGWMGRIRRMDR